MSNVIDLWSFGNLFKNWIPPSKLYLMTDPDKCDKPLASFQSSRLNHNRDPLGISVQLVLYMGLESPGWNKLEATYHISGILTASHKVPYVEQPF
jgi:hypothetical protein